MVAPKIAIAISDRMPSTRSTTTDASASLPSASDRDKPYARAASRADAGGQETADERADEEDARRPRAGP